MNLRSHLWKLSLVLAAHLALGACVAVYADAALPLDYREHLNKTIDAHGGLERINAFLGRTYRFDGEQTITNDSGIKVTSNVDIVQTGSERLINHSFYYYPDSQTYIGSQTGWACPTRDTCYVLSKTELDDAHRTSRLLMFSLLGTELSQIREPHCFRDLLDNKPCFRLGGILQSGEKLEVWVDPESHTIQRTSARWQTQLEPDAMQIDDYSDYRKLDGVLVPFHRKRSEEGTEYPENCDTTWKSIHSVAAIDAHNPCGSAKAKEITVRFDFRRGAVAIPGFINDHECEFVPDTGINGVMIDDAFAHKLKLRAFKTADGAKTEKSVVLVNELRFENTVHKNLAAVTFKERKPADRVFIGTRLLRNYIMTIDFRSTTLPPRTSTEPSAEVVPLLVCDRPFLIADVAGRPCPLLVDTAAWFNEVSADAWDKLMSNNPNSPHQIFTKKTQPGRVQYRLRHVDLRLAGSKLSTPFKVKNTKGGAVALGLGYFQGYSSVTLDFPHERLLLGPKLDVDEM